MRRQEWLKQFNELSMEPNNSRQINSEEKYEHSQSKDLKGNEKSASNSENDNASDIIEIDTNCIPLEKEERKSQQTEKDIEITRIILDPEKEDDTCVILNKSGGEQAQDTKNNEREVVESKEKERPDCFEDFSFKEDDVYFVNNDTNVQSKLLVLPDSDSETENYLKEIKPKIECESFPVQETLHLTFEETFFLLYGLGCLNVIDFDGNLLDIDSAWNFFCKADKYFIQKYVVYHYFRSKGWVVKPGLKYGGDFC